MTANQIAYMQLRESQKHNRATETEAGRHNLASERETNRSNLINEYIKQQQAEETRRSNIANESMKAAMNAETIRSNKANELLRGQELSETTRANKARETEVNRSNLANEYIKSQQNLINQMHYERLDSETNRANLAREAENVRHNMAAETLQGQSNAISRLQATASLQQAQAALHNADTNEFAARNNSQLGWNADRRANYQASFWSDYLEVEQDKAAAARLQAVNAVGQTGNQARKNSNEYELGKGNLDVNQQNANSESLKAFTNLFGTVGKTLNSPAFSGYVE